MDNNTFTAMGPAAFFDRYPVTDLLPQVDQVPYGVLEHAYRWARAKKQGNVFVPTHQVSRLTLGYKDQQQYGRAAQATEMQTVSTDRRVQYFDIRPKSGNGAQHTVLDADCPNQSKSPLTFKLRSNPAHTSIALYYLPYDLNRHRRITLVDHQGVGNVAFFMTDIVDGCSIYVEGTTASPTVSHLNAIDAHIHGFDTLPPRTDPANRKADWSHKAQHMNQRFQAVNKAPKAVAAGVGVQAARRLDYKHYGFRVAADETGFETTLGALQAANRAPVTINGVAVASMQLFHAAGTVFGVRSLGGHWSFHVQRRALVAYADAGGTALGMQWLLRGVEAFWPAAGAGTGRVV